MKKVNLLSLSIVGTTLAGTLHGAIDIYDAATYYDTKNWYAVRNGGNPTIMNTTNGIEIGNFKYDSLFFCYLNPITLDAGEYFQVTGTVNLKTLYDGSGSNTVVGIFDSGSYSQSSLDAALNNASLGHAYNSRSTSLGASAVTGTMAGFLSSPTLAFNRNKPAANSTCVSTNAGGTKIANYEKSFSTPVAGTDYAFSLKILKTATGTYSASFALGAGESVSYDSQNNDALGDLSVLAFKLPVGTGDAVTLSNLRFETTGTVIPEPSLFGLFAGTISLVALCLKRRKSSETICIKR